jgi:hypothetical protein
MGKMISEGWLPYLALQRRERSQNLLLLCDSSYTHGKYPPILETLRLAVQIVEIIEAAHARNIVYRDHKILHFSWDEQQNSTYVIDWNIARRHPGGLEAHEKQFDLVQCGARALHHVLTGRPAPGALPLGPNPPEEIEAAAQSYTPRWTYDDQRLPQELRDILERILAGDYTEARRLRLDLIQIFTQLSELVPKE